MSSKEASVHHERPLSSPDGGLSIDNFLRQVPENEAAVITNLKSHRELAPAQDHNGYSLLHAAASYRHFDLMRSLVKDYSVDPNIADADNETPLFYAEAMSVAKCLIEELGADPNWQNSTGQTADQKIDEDEDEDEDSELVLLTEYLHERRQRNKSGGASAAVTDTGAEEHEDADAVHPPPPLPKDVHINFSTVQEPAFLESESPDPEFRRRIEELASRDDFKGEAGQAELRKLVEDAVRGVRSDQLDREGRDVRRRVD